MTSFPPPSDPPAAVVKHRRRVGKSDGALILWSAFCVILWIVGQSFALAFLVWIVPAFWLTMIYLVARAGRRKCPRCGNRVKTGRTSCGACGREFA